ncbi:MAG: HD domain-containing protein [Deltaproteobacteria bacterium]|nr:HD domain-containing protein [Deltaproteobacteria bacterium]
MAADAPDAALKEMADTGLLWQIFPDLYQGVGMLQPASHHLDVFAHNLETLRQMGKIIADPDRFFPGRAPIINTYLTRKRKTIQLRLAALLHDLGKPISFKIRNNKRTFYNHDLAGAKMLAATANRLKWSVIDRKTIALLIGQHMRPFHLLNSKLKAGITNKAYLKLIKALGAELIGLFLLAMADSLAGRGPGKPAGMEEALAVLFAETCAANENIQSVLTRPLLLNGRDLIRLGQKPGPDFGRFFQELEIRQIDNPGMAEAEARQMAVDFFNPIDKNS